MRYSISESVRGQFPDVTVEALIIRFDDPAALVQPHPGMEAALAASIDELSRAEPITSHLRIARWRTTFGSMGIKPSKYHSSIEALGRRAVRGGVPQTGVDFVDFYNRASIAQLAPMGAYDLAKVRDRHIGLRIADPSNDRFQPLGGDAASFPLNERLVVYADGNEVLCWGINVRDSETVCVDEGTREAVVFCEAMDDVGPSPSDTFNWVAKVASDLGAQCERLSPT